MTFAPPVSIQSIPDDGFSHRLPVHRNQPHAFGELLQKLGHETVQSLRSAEITASAGLIGERPIHETVNSMLAAERSLQVALAVRDRVVSAIQEVTRMSI